jgi:class 3 adenylate cyclase/predicted ATPase
MEIQMAHEQPSGVQDDIPRAEEDPRAAVVEQSPATTAADAEVLPEDEEELAEAALAEHDGIQVNEELGGKRPVSVIFATYSGFESRPGMSQDEIEETSIRKGAFDAALDETISKYGGSIDKVIGQFFMATFGTQRASEDDPVCAVLAAMEMVEAAERFGAEVHVGVNSGLAWVGQIRTERTIDTTVIGDTVNLAARLKLKAGHNEVVVSPATYEATKDYFVYEALPPVTVKGISQPVPIFGVRGQTDTAAEVVASREEDAAKLARLEEAIPEYLREKIKKQSPLPGERKLVTMLYSDVSGFTALSEKYKTQPALIAEVMNRCHKRLGDIIYKHEGVIDKIVGDELMAMFGAPIIHEDDPERAVWCALEMMEEMGKFSKEVEEGFGVPPLTVHIGITTGTVTIGNLIPGSTRMDYTAIGETAEIAAVLEDVSEGGEIVVADRTYKLTRALIDYEARPPVEAAGKLLPIYLVLGKKDVTESKRGIQELGDTPMVGRDAQFAQAKACLADLFEGKGQVLCLIGEAGFGKSRLKRETHTLLSERGGVWIEGACFPNTVNTGYSIFLRAFEDYFNLKESDAGLVRRAKLEAKLAEVFDGDEEAIGEVLPYIGNMLSISFEGTLAEKIAYLEPEQLRRRTFVAVRDLLAREAERQPLIVALDDLHWLDGLSNDLILFLLDMARRHRIILMLIFRPERRDLCWKIGELAAEKYADCHTQIDILPLDPQAARTLLDIMLPMAEDGEQLKPRLLEKAGGNPFYLEEFIRVLLDDEFIERQDGLWVLKKPIEQFAVPDSLEQMLQARIDKLNDEAKVVLQAASVIGRTFDDPTLADIVANQEMLDQEIPHLTDLSFIREEKREPLEYAFGHIVTYEISYGNIVSTRRRALHGGVGDSVERRHHDGLNRVLEQLAFHYYRSANRQRAVHYCGGAGVKALGQFANTDALTFFEQGKSVADQLPDVDRGDLFRILVGLGDVYTVLGRYDEGVGALSDALSIAEAGLDRSRVLRKLGFVFTKRADWAAAGERFEQALNLLAAEEGIPDARYEQARIYDLQGIVAFNKGDFAGANDKHLLALNVVRDTTAYDVLCSVLKNLGNVGNRMGQMDQALSYYSQAIEIAERIGDKVLMSQMYQNLAEVNRTQGNMDIASEHAQKAAALNEQMAYAEGLNASYLLLGTIMRQRREWEQAREYYQKALDIANQLGSPQRIAQVEISFGAYYGFLKDYDNAIRHYLAGLETSRSIGLRQGEVLALVNLSDAYISTNDLEAAERYTREAEALAKQMGHIVIIVKTTTNLGDILRKQDRLEEALKQYREGLDFAVQARNVPTQAEIYRNIGDIYLAQENPERARGHLVKAAELYQQLGDTTQADEIRSRIPAA